MPLLLNDRDIEEHLTAARAVAWVKEGLADHSTGRLEAPPRCHASFPDGRLVLTPGRHGDQWFGYRIYDTFEHVSGSEQLVVVHDGKSGRVKAIATGDELGARRTGAIGGVAMGQLQPQVGPRHLGLIGAGAQAWTQLWAISAAVDLARVRVYSRTPELREDFARRARAELGLDVTAVADPKTAVHGASLIVLATNSSTPVIETDWLEPDVVVTTMGPKQEGRAEFDASLIEGATVVVTDSRAQILAYDPPALLASHAEEVVELGDVVSGSVTVPTTGRRVFASVGLAGTEAHLLARLVDLPELQQRLAR